MRKIIIVILLTLLATSAYGETFELFCYGELENKTKNETWGEVEYYVILDLNNNRFKVYWGSEKNSPALEDIMKISKLSYGNSSIVGDKLVYHFSVNRVNLKYDLNYWTSDEQNLSSKGTCETYDPKI